MKAGFFAEQRLNERDFAMCGSDPRYGNWPHRWTSVRHL